jgi:hypothetical protein
LKLSRLGRIRIFKFADLNRLHIHENKHEPARLPESPSGKNGGQRCLSGISESLLPQWSLNGDGVLRTALLLLIMMIDDNTVDISITFGISARIPIGHLQSDMSIERTARNSSSTRHQPKPTLSQSPLPSLSAPKICTNYASTTRKKSRIPLIPILHNPPHPTNPSPRSLFPQRVSGQFPSPPLSLPFLPAPIGHITNKIKKEKKKSPSRPIKRRPSIRARDDPVLDVQPRCGTDSYDLARRELGFADIT